MRTARQVDAQAEDIRASNSSARRCGAACRVTDVCV